MAYLVNLTTRAERDLARLYEEINAEYSDAAHKWYQGLKKAILSLEERPNRCPVARENAEFRHLLYGHKPHIYRVLYRVLERQKRVEVLHGRYHCRGKWPRISERPSFCNERICESPRVHAIVRESMKSAAA